ncbi:MAG: hypothetical protein WBL31_16175 [Ilumatobacteraceae bacterium]|jgi:hypothetical protein
MELSPRSTWYLTVGGWLLFTVSATCFSVEALRDGSVLAIVASLSFLVACFMFIVPAILGRPRND